MVSEYSTKFKLSTISPQVTQQVLWDWANDFIQEDSNV